MEVCAMSAIQSYAGGGAGRSELVDRSPAMRLLDDSRLGGVLDIRTLANTIVQLAQSNPQNASQILKALTEVLSPLDLNRLTVDVAGVVGAVGDLIGEVTGGAVGKLVDGLAHEVGGVLDGAVDTLTGTTASLRSDLSRRIEVAAVSLGTDKPFEGGGPKGVRLEPTGVGEAAERALAKIGLLNEREAPVALATTGTGLTGSGAAVAERTAVVGRNEATWTLDAQGRPLRAEAVLREVFTDLERSSAETRAQGEAADRGVEGDHGGHVIGHRFVKDQGMDNLFPQNGDFNVSAYKTLENEMADWVEAGAEVRVTVDLLGGGDRPVRVRVAYEVLSAASGDVVYENNVLFRNQADQTFDRTPSSDMKGLLDG
jgi:hypothetical protein